MGITVMICGNCAHAVVVGLAPHATLHGECPSCSSHPIWVPLQAALDSMRAQIRELQEANSE